MSTSANASDSETVRQTVREGYARIARANRSSPDADPAGAPAGCCGGGKSGCCGSTPIDADDVAAAVGYSATELESLPDGTNMGLSCGNPTAIASLKPGEVVLDLGSGGGMDAFIAGPKVGAAGRVIGVDMTPDMLTKARRAIAEYRRRTGLDNVEFRLGEIENLPVPDASVDVVISNCVINLSPDKPRVWHEIARVLKPGGRVAVSDLALVRPLPAAVAGMVEALIGCVAGAVLITDSERLARQAGLEALTLERKDALIDAMADWQDPLYRAIAEHLPPGSKASDYVTSLNITARKPRR